MRPRHELHKYRTADLDYDAVASENKCVVTFYRFFDILF